MRAMNRQLTGSLCGIIGAVCYATNPLGSLFLYEHGVNVPTVLCHRFALATLLLGAWLLLRRTPMGLTRRELALLAVLGCLFGISAYCLYASFLYLSSGLACCILFAYPAMVAVLSALCFRERLHPATLCAVLLSMGGVALLYRGSGGTALHTGGVLLALLSALCYAVYIIIINRVSFRMAVGKMTFWQMVFCLLTIIPGSLFGGIGCLAPLPCAQDWLWAGYLAAVPGIAAMALLTYSIRALGPTPAAVISATEPLVAVLIGCTVFAEPFCPRYALGILLIVGSITFILCHRSKA